MSDIYDFTQGSIPLLVSSPHSGTKVPDAIMDRFTEKAAVLHDTDWHIPELYDFTAEFGASRIEARYSRYVVDLNRPPDGASLYPGQATTGLCPETLFDGDPIYRDGQAPDGEEIASRVETYWRPYHDCMARELARLRDKFGYALLYDCHSIRSVIPRLFDGRLPTLNLGTNAGQSCDERIETHIARVMLESAYSQVVNGRFRGGYITRQYGRPDMGVHAIQMELTQADYMLEEPPYTYLPDRADGLKTTLKQVVTEFTKIAETLIAK